MLLFLFMCFFIQILSLNSTIPFFQTIEFDQDFTSTTFHSLKMACILILDYFIFLAFCLSYFS